MTTTNTFIKIAMLGSLVVATSLNLLASKPPTAVTVSGTVTSEADNQAIPGVSVIEKGTTNGTVTDLDGNYRLSVSGPEVTLVFSFVGFVTQEIPVEGQQTIDVTLSEDVAQLDELVVVGYRS